jgi:hypothetical protein
MFCVLCAAAVPSARQHSHFGSYISNLARLGRLTQVIVLLSKSVGDIGAAN